MLNYLFIICSTSKDSFAFLNKYLATFSGSGEDAYTMNDAKEEAVRAIIEFVKSPDIFQVSSFEICHFAASLEMNYMQKING